MQKETDFFEDKSCILEFHSAFLEVCIEQDLSFFSGKSKLKFDTDKNIFVRKVKGRRNIRKHLSIVLYSI